MSRPGMRLNTERTLHANVEKQNRTWFVQGGSTPLWYKLKACGFVSKQVERCLKRQMKTKLPTAFQVRSELAPLTWRTPVVKARASFAFWWILSWELKEDNLGANSGHATPSMTRVMHLKSCISVLLCLVETLTKLLRLKQTMCFKLLAYSFVIVRSNTS